MKTPSILPALAMLALLVAGCGRPAAVVVAPTPSPTPLAPQVAAVPVAPMGVPAAPVAVNPPAPAAPVVRTVGNPPIAVESHMDQAAAQWTAIKDYTFDQRAQFLSGAGGLIATFDGQVAELRAKRATLPSTVDTKDWDFAMSNLVDSQSYLKSMVTEAGQATPDTWEQEKEKVDQAWQKAQDAFEKVKTTTTSS
jgi:hypothetical protein